MWAEVGRPLSFREMEVVESNAAALGVSVDALMERAGRAVAEEAMRHLPAAPARVAIVAGTGNKGGDGACVAHHLLEWGYQPEFWILRPPAQIRSHSARRCFERVERRLPVHVGVPRTDELAPFPLVVDAMLGTGQSGTLRSPYQEAVAAITASRVPTLSIDLPTGSRDPGGLRPTWTVALTLMKEETDPATVGELVVRDIGIPPAAWTETGPGEFVFYPAAALEESGRRARVAVIGGGPYAGAPALSALAALRAGAERATVLAPGGAAELVQSFSPNLVVRPFGRDRFTPGDVAPLLRFLETSAPKAVVLGMGAGSDPVTTEAMGQLERALAGRVPMVIDADALRALSGAFPAEATGTPVVATPNPGEFIGNFGSPEGAPLTERRHHASNGAGRLGLTVVVKGDPDIISDGAVTVENHRHSPFQTVGGVGDVLGGVVGTLLAFGLSGLHAARLGTYWVGEAGMRAAGRRGPGLVATDVVDELPATLVAGLTRVRHPE
jgi:ADP-dependent NAD(P)H-hydrate dehydratase / NAD(P)H-hydrate epimerase